MKILFPFVGDSVGGSHLSTVELYKVLKENGYEALVILHNKNGPLASILKNNDIEFIELKTSFLAGKSPNLAMIFFSMIWNILPLAKFIRKNNIDIVHGNDLRINLTWSIAARVAKSKFVWHQRTILSDSPLWKFIPLLSSHFIAISQSVLDSAPKNLKESRCSLVYNAFDISSQHDTFTCRKKIIQQFNLHNETLLLGYVGRLVSYKNVDFLVSCLPDLIGSYQKDIHLLIIGTGSENYSNYLNNMVIEMGLTSKVTFTGFVNNPLALIAGLDILVASSGIDAFGRTIVEAMLQSTPVLAANKGGHLEIISDNVTGLLYQANNSESFKSRLIKLIDDETLRISISKSAFERSTLMYSRDTHLQAVEYIYKSLF